LRMNNTKTKSRSLLTDEHLTASLHISTSTVGADIYYLCKQKTMPLTSESLFVTLTKHLHKVAFKSL